MDVLARITKLRLDRGWTEYELAKRSGLPQSTISTWYSKNMLPTVTSLESICKGFCSRTFRISGIAFPITSCYLELTASQII